MHYDILIIGGGSGGYAAAVRAAQLKLSVAIIEKESMGGACLNWGCIPTKTLYRNAEFFKLIEHSSRFGVKIKGYEIDVSAIQVRKNEVIERMHEDIQRMLIKYQIPIYRGMGSFIDDRKVNVTLDDGRSKVVEGDHIIIATGSTPVVPPLEGVLLDGVYTSNEMLEFNEIPKELVIVGAGVVGMEFACIFQAFGSKVKVISTTDRILARIDADVTKELSKEFIKNGGEIYSSVRAQKFTYDEKSKKHVAWVSDGIEEKEISGDVVLLAIGRKPFTSGLGLENAGVESDRGAVLVDEHMKTSVDHIYAIGDVNRVNMLAYTAANQGIRVVEQISRNEPNEIGNLFASCIFVFPELAFVGMTEEECQSNGIEYHASKYYFEANGKALALDETKGFVKVLSDKDENIIGVHILGPHATDLIHEAVLAMQHKMKVDDIINTIHAHPTLSEAFREAVLGLKDSPIISKPVIDKTK
ncbi:MULTISPECIES: dihydrolipoyl dehydrogenase [unclassified Fusibacter]|uniref:dihydrolipoyl dehydrogenase n=1 Tax=unclassified Fusibacter TaxID=2624464 RepID=UPI0010115135|nr:MULTISPECIES: dihydrolipoyl dehydrogenase [unclassified Fusibacter]MCK8061395.1 dihydrolipoyl dehydrogenase [Fusibacter sp. A2]NPE23562.1 dihydrolipoyl dehydrogenase [Fusibacter sp. A1]RXV58972.1 dihydrolipoyl dehydrogenase [Fusibacter sp. A1]